MTCEQENICAAVNLQFNCKVGSWWRQCDLLNRSFVRHKLW